MMDLQEKTRVCVIGGGASGLCALRHFAANLDYFKLEAFEQMEEVGGTWTYNEKTGLDTNGLPVHSSMYRDLKTNLPCEIMNFPDYRKMIGDKSSAVTHQNVLAYLKDYAEHFQLCQFIRFNTTVKHVQPEIIENDNKSPIWKVQVQDLKTSETFYKEFDAVIICTGQYFEPFIPVITGIETFSGKVLHSHSYRKPEDFSGKSVVVIGASSSGIDISIEISAHTDRVYLSHYKERIHSILPPTLTQVVGINRIEKDTVYFENGNSVFTDAIIFCTGYSIRFPSLNPSCGIIVDDNYVSPIYKSMININYPSMCFLGLNSRVVPFPMFHIKAQYFLALLKQRVKLPTKGEMLEDSKLKTEKKRHAHHLYGTQQWSYYESLAQAGEFEPLPPFYRAAYEVWSNLRKSNLWHYKDYKLIIADDSKSVKIILQQ